MLSAHHCPKRIARVDVLGRRTPCQVITRDLWKDDWGELMSSPLTGDGVA
jgi:hypothetical protein